MPDNNEEEALTPYQGERKCYGHFNCTRCANKWTSKHSWANTSQKCKQCHDDIYPHAQFPMEEGFRRKNNSNIPHDQELCGKCQELGQSCVKLRRSEKRRNRRRRRRRRQQNQN